MARNTATKKVPENDFILEDDFTKELEEALDVETVSFATSNGELDIAASMEELEAQITMAAEELAREGENDDTTAARQADEPETVLDDAETPSPLGETESLDASESAEQLEIEEQDLPQEPQRGTPLPAGAAAVPLPANDDRQSEFHHFARRLDQRPPRTIYWLAAALSAVWIVAGLAFAHIVYGPQIWQVRSLDTLTSAPYAIGVAVGIIMPVVLFWGFAIMVRRAQEMRLAARQMAEIAFRLSEPENIAQERVMMVGQAVRREVQAMGEGIERTLARAVELETLVHTEVNELERAYSENESRIRLLVDSLGTEREGIVSHAERVRASITGAHEVIRDELDAAGEQIRISIDGASQNLSSTLNQSSERLAAQLSQAGEAVERAMEERTLAFSQHLSSSGDTLADLLDSRLASLTTSSENLIERIGTSSENLIERIGTSSEAVNRALEERTETLSQHITTSGNGVAELLDTRIAALTKQTDDATRTLGELFDTRTTRFENAFGETAERLNAVFANRMSEIERTLSERGETLISEFTTRAEALDTGIERLESALEARARNINESLVERTREIADTFAHGRQEVSAVIEEGKGIIDAELAGLVASTATMLQGQADEFSSRLREGHAELEAKFDREFEKFEAVQARMDAAVETQASAFAHNQERLTDLLETDIRKLSEIHGSFENRIEGQLEKLIETRSSFAAALDEDIQRIGERRDELTAAIRADIERVNQSFAEHSGVIEERTQTMQKALSIGIDNVRQTLESSAGVVASALREKVNEATMELSTGTMKVLDDVDGRIAERIAGAAAILNQQVDQIGVGFDGAAQRLGERVDGAVRNLDERVEYIDRAFDDAAQRISMRTDEFRQGFEDIDGRLAARISEASERLGGSAESVARTFEEVDQRIIARTHQTSAELDARAAAIAGQLSEVENRLKSTAGSTASAIVGGMMEIEQRLGESADRTKMTLSEGIGEAEERLKAGAEQAAMQVSQQLSRTQADLVSTADTIGQTFASINEHIAKRTGETVHTLDERTRELNTMLAGRTSEIARILDETAKPLVERFEASGGDLQREIEAITQKTTERLQQENAALVNALASRTADTLGAMERARNSLVGDVSEVLNRLDSSGNRLTELVETTSQQLLQVDEKLTGTTQQFALNAEKAAETFSNSASLINANSGRLADFSERTLREISTIASRFEDHSRVLEDASELLEKAQSGLAANLDGRQAAFADLANGLVEKSEQIERIMRSFESLVTNTLDSAEGRTRESVDSIREAINQVVDVATNRFAGATNDLRRTAEEIRSELEVTRADMQRGIVELPEEARQSTSAMRKAITEQINALKELSDIVAKSGRLHDVGTSAPTPDTATPVRPLPASSRAMSEAAVPAAVLPRPIERHAAEPAPEQTRPTPRPQQASGTPAAPAASPNGNGGWIRDLLRSASREEESAASEAAPTKAGGNRSALQMVESLNSLSLDIARAIDHDASVELWERYRQGERNVFTRRLYTLKGQQTFDEIQRKYRADAEFRKAVDQYCRDFERLLADVSRSDRDNMMSQTYLTSDTGKVYTMLAHASGRLR